jgi:sodium-dependent dicarboxylate transporter 2/3/5
MARVTVSKQERKILTHSLIGVAIMIGFRFLPLNLPEVTPIGKEVIGIFLGTLYLWSTVDPIWGSLIAVGMVGFSSFMPMGQVLKECFGNPTLIQCLYLMVMSGALVHYKVTAYIGRFFLTRKFTNGRPWLLSFVICIGCFIMAAFVNAFTGIFLFWPVLYDVFDEIGYKKGDAYPRVIITLVVVSALIGFPVAPFAQNGLALLSNFATITEKTMGTAIVVNNAAYLGISLSMGIICIIACILYAKFILRPDVSKLKELNVETMNRHPLPPMTLSQKLLGGSFVVLVLLMLIPSVFPTLPGMAKLGSSTAGIGLTVTAVLAAVRIKGKALIDVPAVLATDISWSSYYIIAAAIFLGSVMTDQSTGVSAFLEYMLSPIFSNMSPIVFTIALLLAAGFLTNLCNSLVIGMILQPIIVSYCMQTGANAGPIVTVMILFVLLSAAITPAASPFAALLHGNKEWVPTKYVYQYTIPLVLIELVIYVFLGIPLANILM